MELRIGHRLRLERLMVGKSRADLARAIGVDSATLRSYEEEQRRIPADRLARACQVLQLPLSLLFYEGEDVAAHWRSGPWHRLPRPPKFLRRSDFAAAHPILREWRARRGRLDDEIARAVVGGRFMRRVILARQPAGSSRLICEHFSAAITIANPCETLGLIGREMSELTDKAYNASMAEAYARAAWDRALRLESVLADIRTARPGEALVRARYDRVLIPWRTRSDTFVLCLSFLRGRSVPAGSTPVE